jgi:hypothetical protein
LNDVLSATGHRLNTANYVDGTASCWSASFIYRSGGHRNRDYRNRRDCRKTAALGLEISPNLLALADEVIEQYGVCFWNKADMVTRLSDVHINENNPMSAFDAVDGAHSAAKPERR